MDKWALNPSQFRFVSIKYVSFAAKKIEEDESIQQKYNNTFITWDIYMKKARYKIIHPLKPFGLPKTVRSKIRLGPAITTLIQISFNKYRSEHCGAWNFWKLNWEWHFHYQIQTRTLRCLKFLEFELKVSIGRFKTHIQFNLQKFHRPWSWLIGESSQNITNVIIFQLET